MRKIRLGELFCGPGGIAKGAHKAASRIKEIELSHAWAVDSDPDTCETYIKNIKDSNYDTVFCEDIRKLEFKNLINASKTIDGLAFGFPCNDFSLVGQQKGMTGKFGPLYNYGVIALKMFKPDFFVAENVGGILSSNNGGAIEKILADLEGVGYDITPHIYKFEEYGIPQARHRLIIVGFNKKIGINFRPPKPTHLGKFKTAKDAIEGKPIAKDAFNHERTIQSELVVKRLSFIKPGENAWNANLPPSLRLNVKGAKLSQIYKRLHPDKPSYTITGSGGGGTHVYHWRENRALTNRERARLQTFPDNFEFIGGKESVRKQIGMAVPPDGAAVIFDAVFKSLLGVKYPSIDPVSIFARRKQWK